MHEVNNHHLLHEEGFIFRGGAFQGFKGQKKQKATSSYPTRKP